MPEFQICQSKECNDAGSDGLGVGGRSGFKHSLKGLSPIKGFQNVKAFLIVSDNDKVGSFREVQDAFTLNGHVAPLTPDVTGTIYGKPAAVLMIPSHLAVGDLEALCLPEIHRTWPTSQKCVQDFLACTGADAWTKPGSINKARVRAATVGFYENDPFKGLGHLFRSGDLDVQNACFDGIANYLRDFDTLTGI